MIRIRTLTTVTLSSALIGALCLAYSYFIEPGRLVVNRYEMEVKDWNPAFNGFRVALISDIHAGSNDVSPSKLREVVRLVNEQGVDAVFMLGDFVSQRRANDQTQRRTVRMEPAEIAENLKGMHSRFGVFAVLGNHDEWSGPGEVAAALESVGYNVLNGEMVEFDLDGRNRLRVLGLPDHTTIGIWKNYSGNAKRFVHPSDGTGDLIALQHSPDAIPAITGGLLISPDLKVLFAGHTHGGQIRLPILGPPVVPSMFGQKFARGHVYDFGIDVFVTTGIGTSILPFRFMVPPEIAVVTIRRKEE